MKFNRRRDWTMKRIAMMTLLFGLAWMALASCGGGSVEAVIVPSSLPAVNPANFANSHVIDNRYFPLKPGTTAIYDGTEGEDTVHIEEFVTHETKRILGVSTVVVRVKEWVNDELVEDTSDWYAQDNDGNVWYFGEDSREYEDGEEVSTEGSWQAGVDGAQPGIIMKANPGSGSV